MLKYLLTQLKDVSDIFISGSEVKKEINELGSVQIELERQSPSDDDNYFDAIFLGPNFEELVPSCDCRINIYIIFEKVIKSQVDLTINSSFYYKNGEFMRFMLLPHYFKFDRLAYKSNTIESESFPKRIEDVHRHCLKLYPRFNDHIKLIDFEKIKLELI